MITRFNHVGFGFDPGGSSEDKMRMQAGPSRITIDDLDRIEREGEPGQAAGIATIPRDARKRNRPRSRTKDGQEATSRSSTSLPTSSQSVPTPVAMLALLSPFLHLARAAPPPSRPHPTSPQPTSSLPPIRSIPPDRRAVNYINSVEYPLSLPTERTLVDETRLPYILSQASDGKWEKEKAGWVMYGRQSGITNQEMADNRTEIGGGEDSTTFAVEQALPVGWGRTSNRTSIYKIPLIVSASVILAILIVVIIISIVLNRRKAHRRARRRAERERRKALAAAGVTEDCIAGTAQQHAFNEKLGELETQHRSRKRGNLVRIKVRRWNAGLRRRNGKGRDDGGGGSTAEQTIVEDIEVEPAEVAVPTNGMRRRSTESVRSIRSRESLRGSMEETVRSTATSPREQSSGEEHAPVVSVSTTYFPPAYRPASVRRYPSEHSASGSSTSLPEGSRDERRSDATGAEKTRAPGYYPAPTTVESEVALAVASRSDGKQRMRVPDIPIEEEADRSRMGHVATDDKRVLEQLRLGASAPPVQLDSLGDTDGPSAPDVHVDEQGFEQVEPDSLPSPADLAPPVSLHPDLPAPPQSIRQRSISFRQTAVDEHDVGVHEQLDELNLLPSAPPAIEAPWQSDIPSAPPLPEEEDEQAPFAPPFEMEGDDEEVIPNINDNVRRSTDSELGEGRDRGGSTESSLPEEEVEVTRPAVPLYLPRYEP